MEEDINDDVQTMNIPRRGRWYTRLWHSCLGLRCMHPQKKKKFPLYLIGYDPIGPLQRAASVGDLDMTEKLIQSSQHHVDESDRRNRTSLHYACAHNHPDVVTLLLQNNSSINIRDDEGCTALIKAIQRDNVDCASVLLTHNANPNLMDFSGNAALHHAICRGNLRIVKMLLEHNVDIEAKTEYGLTPLQLANFEQKPEMVEFLAAKCAKSSLTPSWSPSPTVSPCPSSTSPLSSLGLTVCPKPGTSSLSEDRKSSSARRIFLSTRSSAKRTKVKHVRFKKEVLYFKEERPLSW